MPFGKVEKAETSSQIRKEFPYVSHKPVSRSISLLGFPVEPGVAVRTAELIQ